MPSCKTEEDKLNDMVANTTMASLYIPESYDPISTKCDTLARNILTEANIKKSAKIISLMREAESLQSRIDSDIESREYWRGKYGDFYNDYSKKVQRNEEKRNELKTKANKLFSELIEDYNSKCEFRGFVVEHKFRAKNNFGNIVFGDVIYILNKDKTEIIAAYDTSDDDFIGFVQMARAIGSGDYNLDDICNNIKYRYEL